MDTSIIEEFLTLKETGSFLKAADRLGLSQSTLSRHIQALEQEVGKPLIDRSSHSFRITPAGYAFNIYALTITEAQKNLINDLNNVQITSAQTLSIGTVHGSESYGIANILREFHNHETDVSYNVSSHPGSELVHKLLHNNLDCIFVWDHEGTSEGQRSIVFAEDHYVLHVPKGHNLYGKSSVHLSELQGEKVYIRSPKYSRTLMYINQECLNLGFELDLNPKPGYWMSVSEDYLYLTPSKQPNRIRHTGEFREVEIYPHLTQRLTIRYRSNGLSTTAAKFINFINERIQM